MVLANLYLLIWNYDRLKYILPIKQYSNYGILEKPKKYNNKFPLLFFIGVIITIGLPIALAQFGYDAMPRNSLPDCKKQFRNTKNEAVGFNFCECIHKNGKPLDKCLEQFQNEKTKNKK